MNVWALAIPLTALLTGSHLCAAAFAPFAQFLAVCSSSILVETLGYAASFSTPWRGKRCVFEWHQPLITDHMQPSTNSDKLSGRRLKILTPRATLLPRRP